MPELAAHLERVAKARTEMASLKPYREQARLLRILTDQCQGLDGGARLIEENLAAALAACAREAKLEEAKWWFQPERHIAHADGTCDCHEMAVARIAALERAVGEKA